MHSRGDILSVSIVSVTTCCCLSLPVCKASVWSLETNNLKPQRHVCMGKQNALSRCHAAWWILCASPSHSRVAVTTDTLICVFLVGFLYCHASLAWADVRHTFKFTASAFLMCLLYTHTQTLCHVHMHKFQFVRLTWAPPQMKGGPLSFNSTIWWMPPLLHVEKTSSPFAFSAEPAAELHLIISG